MDQRHLEQKIKDAKNRDSEKKKCERKKADKMTKTTPRVETASVEPQKANVHVEKDAHSSMTRTRKGRPRSPSPTSSPHRNSKGDGKGSDDGRAKNTPTFIGKSPSGKANKLPCTNTKKGRVM